MTWDLTLTPALDRPELLAGPVRDALAASPDLAARTQVCEIDPELADTAAGLRRGKLVVPGSALAGLPGAIVLDDLAVPVPA